MYQIPLDVSFRVSGYLSSIFVCPARAPHPHPTPRSVGSLPQPTRSRWCLVPPHSHCSASPRLGLTLPRLRPSILLRLRPSHSLCVRSVFSCLRAVVSAASPSASVCRKTESPTGQTGQTGRRVPPRQGRPREEARRVKVVSFCVATGWACRGGRKFAAALGGARTAGRGGARNKGPATEGGSARNRPRGKET